MVYGLEEVRGDKRDAEKRRTDSQGTGEGGEGRRDGDEDGDEDGDDDGTDGDDHSHNNNYPAVHLYTCTMRHNHTQQ